MPFTLEDALYVEARSDHPDTWYEVTKKPDEILAKIARKIRHVLKDEVGHDGVRLPKLESLASRFKKLYGVDPPVYGRDPRDTSEEAKKHWKQWKEMVNAPPEEK